jgi:hypothetical protein
MIRQIVEPPWQRTKSRGAVSVKRWNWAWLPDQGEGAERFAFNATATGFIACGEVRAVLDGTPLTASYEVKADSAWVTREVRVTVEGGKQLAVVSDGAGHWRHENGAAIHALDGCIDPDISMTPFTNTLAIRRLDLKVGEAAEIRVAYVLVPELSLHAAPQRYTRLAERLWRFEGFDIHFTADLTVDEHGFVVEYPGLFRRTK